MEPYQVQVIVPVYNGEATLARCLDSLLGQTYPHWQALVVDDASTDRTGEILGEYAAKDPRFRCFREEENRGAAGARNVALSVADAPYLAFLDADDLWEPSMLDTLLRQAGETGAGVVQCQYLYELPGGVRVYPKGAFSQNLFLKGKGLRRVYRRMMTGIQMNHVCMKLIFRPCLEGLRFREDLKTAEDLDFCVRMFQRVEGYTFVTDRLYHYCRSAGSLTGGGLPFWQKLEANRAASRTIAAALPGWGIDRPWYRLLAWGRPYLVAVSKALRVAREKALGKRGKGEDRRESR